LDIESELYEVKRQLQDSKTTGESELKLVQLKVDQLTRENEEVRLQKREIDAALRKSQAENVQALHQVRRLWFIKDCEYWQPLNTKNFDCLYPY